jgi:hypothetical protein
MRKTLLTAAVVAMLSCGLAAPVQAAGPGPTGPGGTVGDCISDGFYGNEPNIVDPFAPGGPAEQEPGTKDGRVVASQSPGPAVTNPDGTVRPGNSIGDYQQLGVSIPEICRTLTATP